MIYILLHDENPDSKLFNYYYSRIEYLLNKAPANGPSCYEMPTDPEDFFWNAPTLWGKPIGTRMYGDPDDPNDSEWRTDLEGEYNGVDYMLLFNLYHLIYDRLFNDPVNITYDLPTTYDYGSPGALYSWKWDDDFFDIGHQSNSAYYTIHSKDAITMNSKVFSNGKILLQVDCSGANNIRMDVSGYNAGLYKVTTTTMSGKTFNRKLLIN